MNVWMSGQIGELWTLPDYLTDHKVVPTSASWESFLRLLTPRAATTLDLHEIRGWVDLFDTPKHALLGTRNCGESTIRNIYDSAKSCGVLLPWRV